jgi:hypothetical protein
LGCYVLCGPPGPAPPRPTAPPPPPPPPLLPTCLPPCTCARAVPVLALLHGVPLCVQQAVQCPCASPAALRRYLLRGALWCGTVRCLPHVFHDGLNRTCKHACAHAPLVCALSHLHPVSNACVRALIASHGNRGNGAHTCHNCVGVWAFGCLHDWTGLAAAMSEPAPGSPLPHLHLPGLGSPRPTSALGRGSPLSRLLWDRARRCHICTGTRLTRATSAPGLEWR